MFVERQAQRSSMHARHLNEQLVRVLKTIGYDVGFQKGQGQYLYDRDGVRYLDLLSGFGVFAIGRNHPALRHALKGVLDAALQLDLKGRHGHEKLMERVAVGYLWGEDTLDSSRFEFIFESKAEEALAQINFFFWTIRGEKLTEDQVQMILQFWRRCLDWAASQPTPPIKVLSSLSRLASFLPDASGDKHGLLLNTAPYVHEHHGAYDFLKELGRLVEGSPKQVCTVLRRFIEAHEPMYDYEDRMRKLVSRLAELGHRAEAIEFCDRLRSLPGLYELFLELTAKPPDVA